MSLSNVLSFRWRLKKNIQSTPTGAIIYAYLLDRCSCLSVGNLVCQVSGMRRNEKCPVETDDDGGVCITQPRQSTPASGSVNLICSELPLLTDLLPGVYRLTCQMRLRRHVRLLVVHLCSPRSSLSVYWSSSQWWFFARYASPRSLLIGDRAAHGGRGRFCRYPWLEKQHQQYGDHRWFDVTLIESLVLDDLSNVYFGMLVQNHDPILFDIWIRSIRLNFIGSNWTLVFSSINGFEGKLSFPQINILPL